jgi:Transglycosylase SLT domain
MRRLVLAAVLLLQALPAAADLTALAPLRPQPPPQSQTQECRAAIAAAARSVGVPGQLLAAIARIESGRYDPLTGQTGPWPWTINAEGRPGVFDTKAQAIASVRAQQAQGVRSIDVGCMQVNLMHHPQAFSSLEQAFDPWTNAAYGARFLNQLYEQTGDWTQATARYHSATPDLGSAYQRKVASVLPEEQRLAGLGSFSLGPRTQGSLFTPGQAGFAATARVFLPPSQPDHAHIIPLAQLNGQMTPGRGLDAYRAAPIGVASRPRG